ncbi:MAG: hypothetical protein ABSH04_03755 [Acidimicrobiales bacterium]
MRDNFLRVLFLHVLWWKTSGEPAEDATGASGGGVVRVEANKLNGASAMTVSDEEREPYLQLALQAFESGSLDADEYTWRVKAIDRATSVAEMSKALESRGPALGREPSRPAYDAVDLARMMAGTGGTRHSRKSNRYTVLIIVVLLLIVLLGIGVWLAARVHSVNPNPSGAPVGPALVSAHVAVSGAYVSVPEGPPLPLSPRK